jgi:2-polyprenyl-6-methoxyphenol hydroxylase-like FAD-dependent oxidoreductase
LTLETIRARCCIAGGGPAGMMLGLLLARAGVDILILEKHADFLRDFRGDTIHPSTLELMHELGILNAFLNRPHQEVRELGGQVGDEFVKVADFSHLPTQCKFIAFMPQWDFLDFIAAHARRYPTFQVKMQAEVIDLLEEDGQVVGVRARTPKGSLAVRADLVVGADGRQSIVREKAELEIDDFGAPVDVLWFRLSRTAGDPAQTLGRFVAERIMVMLNREAYWQCGFVIPKGRFEKMKRQGLETFRAGIVETAPFLTDRVAELQDWDQIKLLTVRVDRLRKWYRPGLLCIGDAAHAMSPVGGVGINLAIQDAVAAANLLGSRLLRGTISTVDLERVQRRRELATRLTQSAQVFVQNRILSRVLGGNQSIPAPWLLKLFQRWPILRRIPARLIGIGVRPEHVQTPNAYELSR